MTMNTPIASLRIARALSTAEAQVDGLLISLAQLQIDLLTARRDTDVPVHTGQKAILRVIAAQQSIVAGQNDVFRVHDVMADIARETGLMDEIGISEASALLDRDEALEAA